MVVGADATATNGVTVTTNSTDITTAAACAPVAAATDNNNNDSANTIGSTGSSIRASSRKNRVYVFRDFVCETYQEYFKQQQQLASDDDTGETTSRDANHNNNNACVILDVAGGKGDLSWLLLNVDGLESVVVLDPRPLSSTSHLLRSVHWLEQHPQEANQRAIPNLPTHQPLAALMPKITSRKEQRRNPCRHRKRDRDNHHHQQEEQSLPPRQEENEEDFREPQHLQIKLDEEFIHALRDAMAEQASNPTTTVVVPASANNTKGSAADDNNSDCPECWNVFWKDKMNKLHDNHNTTQQQFSSSSSVFSTDACFLPPSERTSKQQQKQSSTRQQEGQRASPLVDPHQVWKLLHSIRLVLGFHPDQATEACLDLADILQVPVCIVPCCVFPSEFPHRTILEEVLETQQPPQDRAEASNCATNANTNTMANPTDTTTNNKTTRETRVRTYSQLLHYLQQKQPKLRTATLSFHQTETSRNIVLYTLPEDY